MLRFGGGMGALLGEISINPPMTIVRFDPGQKPI